MQFKTDQRGIAHVVEIVIIAVILLGVAGFIGWRVWDSWQKGGGGANIVANAECIADLKDQDLCKFFTSWKQIASFRLVTTQTIDGKTTNTTFESSNNGQNYHMVTKIEDNPYETISIGDTLYTKNFADNQWWKQTTAVDDAQSQANDDQFKRQFSDDPQDKTKPADQRVQYKKLGTEACGDKTCFKYEIVDPEAQGLTTTIWFDNHDYQVRRMSTVDLAGVKTEQTFSYDNISISAPAGAKELGPNQYIVPGQAEPLTVPMSN